MKIKILEIKIPERFRKDLGDLSALQRSIRQHGQLVPIGVTENHDGYELVHGFRRTIGMKEEGYSEIEAVILPENIHKRWAEADENTTHKHFTLAEIAEIDEYLRPEFEASARLRQQSGRKLEQDLSEIFAKDKDVRTPEVTIQWKGKSAKKIADILGISDRKLEKIRIVRAAATANPELYKPLWDRANRTNKIDKSFKKVKQISRIEEAKKLAQGRIPPNKIKSEKFDLICKDFREITHKEIPTNSIDAVFVDPPYAEEYLYLAKPLGELCYRAQRPATSLFLIAPSPGKSYLHYLFTMLNCGFEWMHYIPIIHSGEIGRLHQNRILPYHKPLLWFYKPDADADGKMTIYKDIQNVIYSEAPDRNDKEDFEWLQSPKETKHALEPVTVPGMRVLDPMMGEGTTGIGALELGLYFTGIEIDKERYDKAYFRLSNAHPSSCELKSNSMDDDEKC